MSDPVDTESLSSDESKALMKLNRSFGTRITSLAGWFSIQRREQSGNQIFSSREVANRLV
jgi:hypothetical protein